MAQARSATLFYVLGVTVDSAGALCVRLNMACCEGASVMRCEPLLSERNVSENAAPRARLMVRLPFSSYAEVVHRLIEWVPSGQIGRLLRWRDHLPRCKLAPSQSGSV
jgi:hypothetical protein